MVPPTVPGALTARAQSPLPTGASHAQSRGWQGRRPTSRGVRRRDVPTIGDVAALAGVSIGTVSKSLNGRPGVSNHDA